MASIDVCFQAASSILINDLSLSFLFLFFLLDRTSLSSLVIPMAEEFGWGLDEKAQVLSAFFAGYVLTQVPAAFLSYWFGAKRVLSCSVMLWCVK